MISNLISNFETVGKKIKNNIHGVSSKNQAHTPSRFMAEEKTIGSARGTFRKLLS